MSDRTGAVSGAVEPKLERPQNAAKSRRGIKQLSLPETAGNEPGETKNNPNQQKGENGEICKSEVQRKSRHKQV